MGFPKKLTTVNILSIVLAVMLFILFPLIGFYLCITYQKNIKTTSNEVKKEVEKNIVPTLTPTPITIPSPNKTGWNRYMSKNLDYYIDYPMTYGYGNSDKKSVSFEKNVNYPHRTNCWIFIDKGFSNQFSQAEFDELKQMKIGEIRVVAKKESSLPSEFKTYERLPDVYFGTAQAKSFVNKKVWEGDHMYIYLYEGNGGVPYIFGGFTTEGKGIEDYISYSELKEIISTLRFLDK